MHWQWSKKRFPAPSQMIDCFHALGYHFELWESGVAPDSGYTDPAARDSWFQKRVSQTLDLGVDFFKQDDPYPRGIMSEEMQAPVQCKTGTGTDQDAEAALIANSLYSETVMRQIEKRTGHRGLVLFNSYFASVGAHRWPTAWAADFKTGTGLVNGSLSAHTMVSSDMDADTPEGIHFGYLTPFTLIDSWAFYQEPWLYPPHIENHHRFYAKLRARLGPHLYTAAWKSHTSGIPIMRPMVLEHPDVQELRMESSQHYLGEGLLVGQNRRVYLPAGEWVDYWTGQSVTSIGAWRECNWLEPACGPLWVRAGSILVTRPVIPNAFAEDNSVLVAEIFPGSGKNTARLYEDDGIGLTYRSGSHRITEFSCREDQGGMEVTVHQVSDTLSQGKDRIAYLFKLHTHWVPKDMAWQGRRLGEKESLPGLVNVPRQTGWCRDAHGPYVWIKVDPQWHFTSDGRGAGDPECDTPAWTGQPLDVNGQLKLIFGSETISPVPESSKMDREADSIRLMLNPPERSPLDDGSWLSQETTVYAWLEAAGQPVLTEGVGISLEVLAKDGTVLRTTSRRTTKGRVEFRNQAYAPGDTVFRVHTERLGSVEAAVRVSPHI
jgi:hypothetical protein